MGAQAAARRVAEQCEDKLKRMDVESEEHAKWKQHMQESMDAQAEENRNLSMIFSLLTKGSANLQEKIRAQQGAIPHLRELEETFGDKPSAPIPESATWGDNLTAQLNEVRAR